MSGRIRTLKPEWLEDELLAAASDEARVLSVALILMADDYGRGRASAATLATGAWRFQMERDDGAHARETLARASRALAELVAMRFVEVYEVDRQRYFAIRNWAKHQRVDKPSRPRIPEPSRGTPVSSRDPRETLASTSENTRARSGPPTSDLDPDRERGSAHTLASTSEDPREAIASEWRLGYVQRFQRLTAMTHGGPAGDHMTTLIDAALAQPDPSRFVVRALDGFFATPRMRTMRPPYAVRWLAEDPAGYAAADTSPVTSPGALDGAALVARIPRLEIP